MKNTDDESQNLNVIIYFIFLFVVVTAVFNVDNYVWYVQTGKNSVSMIAYILILVLVETVVAIRNYITREKLNLQMLVVDFLIASLLVYSANVASYFPQIVILDLVIFLVIFSVFVFMNIDFTPIKNKRINDVDDVDDGERTGADFQMLWKSLKEVPNEKMLNERNLSKKELRIMELNKKRFKMIINKMRIYLLCILGITIIPTYIYICFAYIFK